MKSYTEIYRFKITLLEVSPRVWRRIEVPADYSFWDLHVAIQDAMGWLDSHLHSFRFKHGDEQVEIGIPESPEDESMLAGWMVNMDEYFTGPGIVSPYQYDFGDDWQHEVLLEDILPRDHEARYPRCIAGRHPCPPEDCGGSGGYDDLRRILRNPKQEEYIHMSEWMAGMMSLGGRQPFDDRNPGGVHFDDPRKRWKKAFADWGVQRSRPKAERFQITNIEKREPHRDNIPLAAMSQYRDALAALIGRTEVVRSRESRSYARHLGGVVAFLAVTDPTPGEGLQAIADFFRADEALLRGCDDSRGSVKKVFTGVATNLFGAYATKVTDKRHVVELLLELERGNHLGTRDRLVDGASQYLPAAILREMIDRLTKEAQSPADEKSTRGLYRAIQSLARQLNDESLSDVAIRAGDSIPKTRQ